MGVFKFYWLVLREAFRHAPDLTQTIIFFLLLLAGAVASGNPEFKPMIEAYDLSGWKVAAIVFGTIIALRLLLAPYWLWEMSQSKTASTPERSIEYKLVVAQITNLNDIPKKAIQIIFVLHNTSYFHSIRYEVEEVYVEVDGNYVDGEIAWNNKGEIIPAQTKYNFDYAWIFLKSKKWIKPGTQGHIRIVFKYSAAGQEFTRRVTYAGPIVIEKNRIRINPTEKTRKLSKLLVAFAPKY